MKFHRDNLQAQIRSLMRQLAENGDMNTPYPVSGRTENWCQFFWGHPDKCQENWATPFVFAYDFELSESYQNNRADLVACNLIVGVQANCQNITGLEYQFEDLWYKIRRLWGKNSLMIPLAGTYEVVAPDGTKASYTNTRLGLMGFSSAQMLGSFPADINNGTIRRYTGQLQFEFLFKTASPEPTLKDFRTYN